MTSWQPNSPEKLAQLNKLIDVAIAEKGLKTSAGLAAKAGLHPDTLTKFRNGTPVRNTTAVRIITAMGFKPDDEVIREIFQPDESENQITDNQALSQRNVVSSEVANLDREDVQSEVSDGSNAASPVDADVTEREALDDVRASSSQETNAAVENDQTGASDVRDATSPGEGNATERDASGDLRANSPEDASVAKEDAQSEVSDGSDAASSEDGNNKTTTAADASKGKTGSHTLAIACGAAAGVSMLVVIALEPRRPSVTQPPSPTDIVSETDISDAVPFDENRHPKLYGDASDVSVAPRVRYYRELLVLDRVWVSGVEPPYDIFFRVNGGKFRPVDNPSYVERSLNTSDPQELLISIRENDTGEEIIRVDKTLWYKDAVQEFGRYRFRSFDIAAITKEEFVCDISGCFIYSGTDTICSPEIASVAIESDGKSFTVPRDFCERADRNPYDSAHCFPAYKMPVPLRTEQPAALTVTFKDGRRQDTPLPVPVSFIDRDAALPNLRGVRSYDLHTSAHESSEGYFSAVATFQNREPIAPHHVLGLALDRCIDPNQNPPPILYLNINGEGFFQAGHAQNPRHDVQLYVSAGVEGKLTAQSFSKDFVHWELPPNTPSTIEVAVGDKIGIKRYYGTVIFDPEEIATRATLDGAKPSIACTGSSAAPDALRSIPKTLCVPTNRMAMIGVSEVLFRSSKDSEPTTIPIEFSYTDFSTQKCAYHKAQCPPLVFEVPSDWKSVFTQMVLKNGETTPPLRHMIE